MVCKNCGRKVVATDRFCPDCGTPIVVEEPVVETPAVTETPARTTKTRTTKTAKSSTAEPRTSANKSVNSSSLLQAISAARNSSKLAQDVETSGVTEEAQTPVVEETVAQQEVPAEAQTTEQKAEVAPVTETENAPFIPTTTPTKKAKGFGIASIIVSILTMLVLGFVLLVSVLMLTTSDAGSMLALILFGGFIAIYALTPVGIGTFGAPALLTLILAIVQACKAKRALSWVALVLAIITVLMVAALAVLTFTVNWSAVFENLSFSTAA